MILGIFLKYGVLGPPGTPTEERKLAKEPAEGMRAAIQAGRDQEGSIIS